MIALAIESSGARSIEAFLATIEAGARKQFLTAVTMAMAAIKAREDTAAEMALTTGGQIQQENENIQQKVELQNADFWRDAARRNLDGGDPSGSMHKARCGAEAVAKHLYRFLGFEHNGRPAKTMRLEDLLKAIEKSDAPDVLKRCLNALQILGNFGSHDQNDEFKYLDKNIAEPVLRLYDAALTVYRMWLQDKN